MNGEVVIEQVTLSQLEKVEEAVRCKAPETKHTTLTPSEYELKYPFLARHRRTPVLSFIGHKNLDPRIHVAIYEPRMLHR